MKIKTSELQGAALDYMVALIEGREMHFGPHDDEGPWFQDADRHPDGDKTDYGGWELCGPIIEREHICLLWDRLYECWNARDLRNAAVSFNGPTPLIAAMRCFVASRLGDEVDVPEELR